jgi:hypothetical protein
MGLGVTSQELLPTRPYLDYERQKSGLATNRQLGFVNATASLAGKASREGMLTYGVRWSTPITSECRYPGPNGCTTCKFDA